MDTKWIDTHAHYDTRQFNADRDTLLSEELPKSVQAVITLGTNYKTNKNNIELAQQYDYIFAMAGYFPCDTWELEPELNKYAVQNFAMLRNQLGYDKVVGLGEIGLDYHWNSIGRRGQEIKGEKAREIQKKWFRKQLQLATERDLPVSMHSRDAERDTLEIFDEFPSIKGVMHCFSYGMDSAEAYLNKGLYLGVGGTLTYPANTALREAIQWVPLDRILLETDAPYLSPQPVRRERNDSRNIKTVIELLADLKYLPEEEIIEQTNKNAIQLFGLPISFEE